MTQPPETVVKTIDMLRTNQELIEDQIFDLIIHTPNGGITMEEAWALSYKQRNKLVRKINTYYEKQSGKNKSDYIVKDGQAGAAPVPRKEDYAEDRKE